MDTIGKRLVVPHESPKRRIVGIKIQIAIRWDWFNWRPRINWRYQYYAHWLCFSIWFEPRFSYDR